MIMTDEEKRSCIATIRTLLSAYRSYSNTMIQIDDDNVEKIIKLIQDGGERHKGIKVLEQKPCDNCISREEALKIMCDNCPMYNCVCGCSSYRHIEKMSSVIPQRPKGKWTQKTGSRALCCSVCEDCIPEEIPYAFDYCPNCGADMRGEQNDK